MIASNAAALTAEPTTPKLTIDFSHRVIEGYSPACANNLMFEVETMLMRSKGLLNVLTDLHLETHLNQINSDNVAWALGSVIRELDDVFALVSTYRDAIANQQA